MNMGCGSTKQSNRIHPQVIATSSGAPRYEQHNEKEIINRIQDNDSIQDMETTTLHAQTLKEYKENLPNLAQAFQTLFDDIQLLRILADRDLDGSVLLAINVVISRLSQTSIDTADAAGASNEAEYIELLNFVVEIEAAVVLKNLAENLFEKWFRIGFAGNDLEESQPSLNSVNIDQMDTTTDVTVDSVEPILGDTLVVLHNFADFHDGFCLACAKAGVISMCFEKITRIDEETKDWESKDEDDSMAVDIITSCVGILHNISRRLRDRTLFVNCNSEETLLRFAKVKTGSVASLALLCLAYLVDEETNHLILADENLLEYIITMLDEASESEDRRCEGFSAKELAEGLRHLAINDTNKKVLGEKGAIRILISMLKTSNNDGERASGTDALWMLAFDEGNKDKIREEEGALSTLRELQQSDSPDVQKAAAGALWELEGKRRRNAEKKEKEVSGNHVMISYQWDAQHVLIEVKNRLQANGYRVWMDLEQMGGSTLESMAKAVENASVVLVCVSQRYKESPNCRSEAEYAYQLRKDIIPLMVQRNYKPDGWLGMIVGTKLWIDFKSKQLVQAGTEKLVKELAGRGKDIANEDLTDGYKGEVVRKQIDQVLSSPAVSVISNWNSGDVEAWLKEIGLDDVCKKALPNLDGQTLMFLYELREECPEYYYNCLKQDLFLSSMFNVFKFREELNKLMRA